MSICFIIFLFLLSLSPCALPQQSYYITPTTEDCSVFHPENAGYVCNVSTAVCNTVAYFRVQSSNYATLNAISDLFSVSSDAVASASGLSSSNAVISLGQGLYIPLKCTCFGNYSSHYGLYTLQAGDTFYLVANYTYEGLTTCQVIQQYAASGIEPVQLVIGQVLNIPIRCACPSAQQQSRGISRLATYPVADGDTVDSVVNKFGITQQEFLVANGLPNSSVPLFPATTVLLPFLANVSLLPLQPSSSLPSSSKTDTGCLGGLFYCNKGAKIGITASLAIVVLGVGLALLSYKRAKNHVATGVLKKALKKLQKPASVPNLTIYTMGLDELTERPMEYSYSSIASATKSFSTLMGEGGFGVVYKGTLPPARSHGGSDLQIAVKVLLAKSKHSKQQFVNEVITIGRIHHVNVVRLLGFCMQKDHEMLVYEFIENGSLDRWLFDEQGKDRKQVLDWRQRYAIAKGIARGLSYLHEECRHRTVHCDIKPQNILLDGEMCPKIADFGLARLMSREESKVVTMAKGTPGYMAPEFWMGGESQIDTKFDVYSYGMMLLELVSGQRNFRRDATSLSTSIPAMAFQAATQGDLESILDTRLGITRITPDSEEAQKLQWHQIKTAVLVALWCIQDRPASRLSMSEVVKYLEGGASVSECLPQPTASIFYTSSSSSSSTSPKPQYNDSMPPSSTHYPPHLQQGVSPITSGR